ncbi:BspA family leucine-rich repeat surface protein [Eggerthellaceae bacterium 24-137]
MATTCPPGKAVQTVFAFITTILLVITVSALAKPAYAEENVGNSACAILYDDGTLVLQQGAEPDPEKRIISHVERIEEEQQDMRWASPLLSSDTDPSIVQRVVVKDEMSPLTTDSWFCEMSNLTNIEGISKIKTSRTTSMESMFEGCASLLSLDLTSLDTSQVTSLNNMFEGCKSLTSLDLSYFDASKVASARYTFARCESLTSLTLPASGMPHLQSTYMMFDDCASLKNLDISKINTTYVWEMQYMFSHCESLTSLDLSHFSTKNAYSLNGIFNGCESLTAIDLSSFNTSNVTDMSRMFEGCANLKTIDLSPLDTSNVTDMSGMFKGCVSLTVIDLSPLDTSNVEAMTSMFAGCKSLQALNYRDLDYSKVLYMSAFFSGCPFKTIDLSNLNMPQLENAFGLFRNCANLSSVNLTAIHTPKLETIGSMFESCASLTAVDFGGMDTAHVTNMGRLFSGCSSLKTFDMRNCSTENVICMGRMFRDCTSLQSCDLSRFRTPSLKSVYGMFENCTSLESVDISNFDMTHVNTTTVSTPEGDEWPFYEWESVPTIVVNAKMAMFKDCRSLRRASLPKADFRNILPDPNPNYIPKATGKWRDENGGNYLSSNLPLDGAHVFTAETQSSSSSSSRPANQPEAPSTLPSTKPSLAQAKITIKDHAYTGKTLKPTSITVKLNGKTLRKNIDYTVSCKGGKKVGSYKVTITGKGSYTGSKAATFKIVPKGTSLSKVKRAKKGFTVTWKKQRKETTGYQIRYTTSKTLKGAKVKTVKGTSKDSLKVSKLRGGKKYYVQIRTYKKIGGKTYYSTWSKAKAAKTAR